MKIRIPFTKMQAAGNDFILMENPELPPNDFPEAAARLCRRHYGIGADGAVFLVPSSKADRRMAIFNPDGSEAEMCGNAARCVGGFLADRSEKGSFTIETLSGLRQIRATLSPTGERIVSVDMGRIEQLPLNVELLRTRLRNLPGFLEAGWFTAGNPHLVIFVSELPDSVFSTWAPQLETDVLFPQKTNVEFVTVHDSSYRVRVWERGVGETKACGTGACSVAKALGHLAAGKEEYKISMPGGILRITESETGSSILTGPVKTVFTGEAELQTSCI